jgi:GDP-mannose 6-dehydrogenase
MRVSIFGLGYVGSVSAAALARCGHHVIGVDIAPDKVDAFARGVPPVHEEGLADALRLAHEQGRIQATTSLEEAVNCSEISLICVGTPTRADGAPELGYVTRVCEDLGNAIATKRSHHLVVLRSTVPGGTTALCRSLLQERAGVDLVEVAFNPEFLREGCALSDFFDPPYTILGVTDERAEAKLRELYRDVSGEVIVTSLEQAEMVKLAANAWHATKITFANEIGQLAKQLNLDGRGVMNLLVRDTKLNVSPAYLRPGFAFGGSCLPKDVRALSSIARRSALAVPLLDSLLTSNQKQIESAAALVLSYGKRDVGILGLAFKPGTDDLRESPAVILSELLLGKGSRLKVFDPVVREAKLVGANQAFVTVRLPHLAELMVDTTRELLEHARVLVVTNPMPVYRELALQASPDVVIVDLCGAFKTPPEGRIYVGAAW